MKKIKKLLLALSIVLVVFIIGFVCIVLFDPFGGIKVKGSVATDEEIEKLEDVLEDFFEESKYSYKYTYKSVCENIDEEKVEKVSIKNKGIVSVEKKEYSSVVSYELDATKKIKSTLVTTAGKKKLEEKIKESVVVVGDFEDYKPKYKYYVDQEITVKEDKSKYVSEVKTQDDVNEFNYVDIKSYLRINSSDIVYIKDETYTIIKNSLTSITEITIKLDGRNLKKVVYESKSSEGTIDITFKIIDFKEISAPRKADKYRSVE